MTTELNPIAIELRKLGGEQPPDSELRRWTLRGASEIERNDVDLDSLRSERNKLADLIGHPIPMLLWCPECGDRHVDVGEFAAKAHHTHACQSCGMVWRPAVGPTIGVQWLPGFKNER